jgi:hypothetical protein
MEAPMPERQNPPDLCNAVAFGIPHAVVGHGGTTLPCAGPVMREKDRKRVGAGDLAAQAALALPGFPIRIGATAAID